MTTTSQQTTNREAYSPREVSKQLGIGLSTVYRHIKAGRLPARRLGKRLLIGRRALERWLAGTSESRVGQ